VGLQQLFKFESKLGAGAAMQALTRDVYRLGRRLDFVRLLSFFFGGIGFYLCNSLIIWALLFFMYSRTCVALFGYEAAFDDPDATSITYWFGQLGFLLTLPIFASVTLEKGLRAAVRDLLWMLITGGPMFFVFGMGTKSYLFEQTLASGGASYRATGRGFLTKHERFAGESRRPCARSYVLLRITHAAVCAQSSFGSMRTATSTRQCTC
jgi:callose synthase